VIACDPAAAGFDVALEAFGFGVGAAEGADEETEQDADDADHAKEFD
jgi:hypothetical protein